MDNKKTKNEKKNKWDRIYIPIILILFTIYLHVFILIPNFARARSCSQFVDCQYNCRDIGVALEKYGTDNGSRYPHSMAHLVPVYIKAIPTCPASGSNQGYINSYFVSKKFDAYTFTCQGTNHKGVGLNTDYPQYNSNKGLVPGK